MPEYAEVEAYRRLAESSVGRRIDGIDVRDERLLRRMVDPARLAGTIGDQGITGARRIGKVLLLDVGAHTVAFGFGLRGRLLVDGQAGRPGRRPRSARPRERHVRLRLGFDEGELLLEDQLRLATVELDIDESRLGVDVTDLDRSTLGSSLADSSAMLKSRIMDQSVIAGVGNLLADEICWQSGLDPRRRARSLDHDELSALHAAITDAIELTWTEGGSHRGELIRSGSRAADEPCPRDGTPMERIQVAGRTTFWCPGHQR